jgi:hypothetical protein
MGRWSACAGATGGPSPQSLTGRPSLSNRVKSSLRTGRKSSFGYEVISAPCLDHDRLRIHETKCHNLVVASVNDSVQARPRHRPYNHRHTAVAATAHTHVEASVLEASPDGWKDVAARCRPTISLRRTQGEEGQCHRTIMESGTAHNDRRGGPRRVVPGARSAQAHGQYKADPEQHPGR